MKNELILKQKIEGLESQKDYANFLKESNENSLVKFLIHFYSIKCEDNITANNFKNLLEENIYLINNNNNLKIIYASSV